MRLLVSVDLSVVVALVKMVSRLICLLLVMLFFSSCWNLTESGNFFSFIKFTVMNCQFIIELSKAGFAVAAVNCSALTALNQYTNFSPKVTFRSPE